MFAACLLSKARHFGDNVEQFADGAGRCGCYGPLVWNRPGVLKFSARAKYANRSEVRIFVYPFFVHFVILSIIATSLISSSQYDLPEQKPNKFAKILIIFELLGNRNPNWPNMGRRYEIIRLFSGPRQQGQGHIPAGCLRL